MLDILICFFHQVPTSAAITFAALVTATGITVHGFSSKRQIRHMIEAEERRRRHDIETDVFNYITEKLKEQADYMESPKFNGSVFRASVKKERKWIAPLSQKVGDETRRLIIAEQITKFNSKLDQKGFKELNYDRSMWFSREEKSKWFKSEDK